MGEQIDTNTNLWAGSNNEQYHGDDNFALKTLQNKAFPQNIRNWKPKFQYPVLPVNNTTPATGNNTTPATGTDALAAVKAFIANNRLLVLGIAGVIAYFLFFAKGGGVSERVISTRYFGRSK